MSKQQKRGPGRPPHIHFVEVPVVLTVAVEGGPKETVVERAIHQVQKSADDIVMCEKIEVDLEGADMSYYGLVESKK